MDRPGKPSLKLVRGASLSTAADLTAEALSAVFNATREQLIRLLTLQLRSHAEAEDVAHDAYLRLASKSETLRNENLRSLLFVTARNIALDRKRRAVRTRGLTVDYGPAGDFVEQIPGADPSVDRTLIAHEHVQIVRRILDELPPKSSRAFIAYKFNDQDYGTIAQELGVSESMVRKYVIRATAHCVKRFAELEGWE